MSRGFGKDRLLVGANGAPTNCRIWLYQIKRGLQPRRAGLRVLVALRASPVPTTQESQTRHCVHGVP